MYRPSFVRIDSKWFKRAPKKRPGYKRGFFAAVGRRTSDKVRVWVELVLIAKVISGDIPVETLVSLL